MNLYQFFKSYLESQTVSKITDFDVKELSLYYREPIMYYRPDVFKIKKGEETINDMMKALAYCLTRNRYAPMANYNLHEKYDVLCDGNEKEQKKTIKEFIISIFESIGAKDYIPNSIAF